uniref:Uncharacterized protein n=1 Tax=Romanomermis culicivorax TaxID=13658 RepID=A0A915JMR5_ROMCU
MKDAVQTYYINVLELKMQNYLGASRQVDEYNITYSYSTRTRTISLRILRRDCKQVYFNY